jgi:anti-sigma factor ChrR (cupin superfamily)
MIMDHSSADEALGAYALDACDTDECTAVEVHIAACTDCAQEAHRLQEIAGWIGAGEPSPPAQGLRSRILRETNCTQPLRPAA